MEFLKTAIPQNESQPGLMQDAQKIWEMLDELADSDPDAYKRFMEKQLKQGKEAFKALAPPTPGFAFETRQKAGARSRVFINACAHPRILEPEPGKDVIPLKLTDSRQEKDEKGSYIVLEAMLNANVVKKALNDDVFKEDLIVMLLDCAGNALKCQMDTSYKFLDVKFKGDPRILAQESGKFQTKPQPSGSGEPFKDLLSNIKTKEDSESDGPSILNTATQPAPNSGKKCQIIEIAAQSATVPEYSVSKDEQGRIVFKVVLPDVKSVGEVELDVSESDLRLVVPAKYEMLAPLPAKVDDTAAKARFNKTTHTLSVTLPIKELCR
eukprot:Colp12_sorted_trinity150504_noHs@30402